MLYAADNGVPEDDVDFLFTLGDVEERASCATKVGQDGTRLVAIGHARPERWFSDCVVAAPVGQRLKNTTGEVPSDVPETDFPDEPLEEAINLDHFPREKRGKVNAFRSAGEREARYERGCKTHLLFLLLGNISPQWGFLNSEYL